MSETHYVSAAHAKPAGPPSWSALIGEFADVDAVMAAAEKVRDAGYEKWDVHSPLPIHGMDRAMGIRPTILPWIVLTTGLAGLAGGLLLVWWTNAVAMPGVPTVFQGYPYFISGKPLFSLPANIPIIFETTVLCAAFGAVFGMLVLNKLPMLYHPLFRSQRFRRATSDGFFVVIAGDDPRFDARQTAEFLRSLGAVGVEHLET
ncbi:MAG: DUF3341 domain-containing protein [Phycisphaeraceae bacterium]|nr:DUF3341 domain-containing protein [Phycisphaeraceae bacterium]